MADDLDDLRGGARDPHARGPCRSVLSEAQHPLGPRFDLSHAIWQDRRDGRGRQTAVPTRKETTMAKKPNLIVILIDDLRFDETSASWMWGQVDPDPHGTTSLL